MAMNLVMTLPKFFFQSGDGMNIYEDETYLIIKIEKEKFFDALVKFLTKIFATE